MTLDRTRSSLELLLNISRQLASTLDLSLVLENVLSLSITNVDAERGSLIVLDEEKNPIMATIYYDGSSKPYTVKQIRDILEGGLAGWVLKNREPAMISDTRTDERWMEKPIKSQKKIESKSALCVPVMARDETVGVLTMVYPKPSFFNKEDLALIQAITDMAGIAIYNARLFQSREVAVQRYYELFNDSIYPIFITDWQGAIREANRQAQLASENEVDHLRGKSILEMQESSQDILDTQRKELKKGNTVHYETNLKIHNHRSLPVEVYIRKINFKGSESLQWILRDTSTKKELDLLREDLISMIYHDLRSPLANIIASLEILGNLLPSESDPTLNSVFSITHRSAERMQMLINSLLDMNRLEAGQPIIAKKTVDICELANEAKNAVLANFDGRHQKLTLLFPKQLPPVQVDIDMIRRVMVNLLENASKFTPSEGTIIMSAVFSKREIKIWVDDQGPGVPLHSRSIIFEKFNRLTSEGSRKGIGLGLAFCKIAVEAHGGKIWMEPCPPKGSRFIFTLPISINK
jgi:PAS domain S-box-containing protein